MRIAVVGGGIAGLGASLALAGPGREILILDRDPPPPKGTTDEIFAQWERPGATQLRHSHVFLARLYNLLRDRYPVLLARLKAAGARELRFRDGLSPHLRARYAPIPSDEDLSILSCRRTTLELMMRAYAAERPGVSFSAATKVRGVDLEDTEDGVPRIARLITEHASRSAVVVADLIVDAAGRNSPFPAWLGEAGIHVPTDEADSGVLYYTRHYRLRNGAAEPNRNGSNVPSAGDLGYLRYCVFPADAGNFSITLALPETETALRTHILDGAVFDRICARLPAVAPWTNVARAEPASRVFAMGNLRSVWRDWIVGGRPLVLDFFAIGDATMRTNPLYGRGCATGVIQAHILAEVLRATHNPMARAKFFAARMREELKPFYDAMIRQDSAWMLRAQRSRPPAPPRLRARLMRSFAEDAVIPAARGSLNVARQLARPFHMLEGPNEWMASPDTMALLFMTWSLPRAFKGRFYPGRLGPDRRELYALAGLPESA